jgi:hypothetical protein
MAVLLLYASARKAGLQNDDITALASNGNVISLAVLASNAVIVGFVLVLIALRRYPVRDYLAIHRPTLRQTLVSTGALALLIAVIDTTSHLLGRPIVPRFMVGAYLTAWLPLLLLALLVGAPFGEEVLMRGFLFKGIAESRWGPVAAILLTALLWASLHIQYDLYSLGQIVVMGLYIGWVRYRTTSLPLVLVLHAFANTVATVEVAMQVHWLG